MNRYAISKNILRYLERYGMTQAQLAEKIGVNPVAMSRWMNGVRPPTVYALKRIARGARRRRSGKETDGKTR